MPKGVYGEKQACWQRRKDLWSDERTALLKRWWANGSSAAVVADRLNRTTDGPQLTRNSVIGKISRLGLFRMQPKAPPRLGAQRPRRLRPPAPQRTTKPAQSKSATPPLRLPEPEPLFGIDLPQGERCTLAMLTRHTCRWPMGDPSSPDFYFCGWGPEPGHSYCAYHCCIAYQREERKPRAFVEAAE